MAESLPTSPRLRYRRMGPGDLDDMARLLGDAAVMAHYPRPRTREEAAAWIRWNEDNYARDGFGLWLLRDHDGTFVGDCGLTWQRVGDGPDAPVELELGYHLLPAHQGLGLATEGALACRELARARGVERLIAIIHPDNVASQGVAVRAGLALELETSRDGLPISVYAARL